MKKFTKGCLIMALILFILGCAFYGIFGVLGGFRQLDDGAGRIGNLSFGYHNGQLGIGAWDEEDWEDEFPDAERLATGTSIQTDYHASDITNLDIELGGCNLVIEESADDYIWIENKSNVKSLQYGMEKGTFKLRSKINNIWLRSNEIEGKVYLYLPKGMQLNSIDIEVGAGKVECISLEADEISLEAGAGKFDMEDLKGNEIDISIGAGQVDVNGISAGTVSIEVGAGECIVAEADIKDADLEVSMGNIDINGIFTGNLDAECSMGDINMKLRGAEEEHNYYLECSMGSIRIGETKYANLTTEKSVYNGSRSDFKIECSMGSIDISFAE